MTKINKKIYDLGDTIDYEYTHAGRFGAKGEKRAKRQKPTPEQVIYQNRMNKAKQIRRLIKPNLTGGWLLTLTWAENKPANMKEAKDDFNNFRDRMAREYKKRGKTLKCIWVIEIGQRGGRHVHVVINDIEDLHRLVNKHWTRGHPNFKALYKEGDYRELAKYLAGLPKHKDGKKAYEGLKPQDKESYYYSRTRNMIVPVPDIRKYHHWTMRKVLKDLQEGKATEGYYIDKDSICQGVNPFTGLSYLYYSEHRIRGGDSG